MTEGVDYAWGRPSVRSLKQAGISFACRYLSNDTTGKNLTRPEADLLSSSGIWLVAVWEGAASRALDGLAAGQSDAAQALRQARVCGMPHSRPIYFAVDFDSSASDQPAINSYFEGVSSVLGAELTGIYGGYWSVSRTMDAGLATWGWQTYAWSGGNWYPHAHIQQYSNDHVIDGVGLDFDRATKTDYGQWKVGEVPSSGAPPDSSQEDDMPFGLLGSAHQATTPIAIPKDKYTQIAFVCDNGIVSLPAVKLRVAQHVGSANWHVDPGVVVDSAVGATVIKFADPHIDGLSVRREDDGAVPVAWVIS